jgi:hypothetical protein
MKAGLQPSLPGTPRVSVAGEESLGCGEESPACLQLLAAPSAPILGDGDLPWVRPPRETLGAKSRCALRQQRPSRPLARPAVQPSERSGSQSAQPTVQRGSMWMSLAQSLHRLTQTQRGQCRVGIGAASRLDHGPGVALEGRDFDRQDPRAMPAELTATQRNRRQMALNASGSQPVRVPIHPLPRVDQSPGTSAVRASRVGPDTLSLACDASESSIPNGNGNGYGSLSGSRRGTGVLAPVPHFREKTRTLLSQHVSSKRLIHPASPSPAPRESELLDLFTGRL